MPVPDCVAALVGRTSRVYWTIYAGERRRCEVLTDGGIGASVIERLNRILYNVGTWQIC